MMNYIQSELYRISRTKSVYMFTIFFMILGIVMNGTLAWFGAIDENFIYNYTSFAYSQIVGNPMAFAFFGMLITIVLYEGNQRSGNMKNTIAFGLSREKVFTGMCIITTVVSIVIMFFILSTYLMSAMLLLKSSDVIQIHDVILEIGAVFLIAVASNVSVLCCLEYFSKSGLTTFMWLAAWSIVPSGFKYMTAPFTWLNQMVMLLPHNHFGNMKVNMVECSTVWKTPTGMFYCVAIGFIHLFIIYVCSLYILRKRDI